ncbi:MAG: type II secretion system F family protein [Gammaproteobacteria bacterium]|nr:type II secretion system F family protein [Gammaproteobacteria bacterium]
MSISWVDLNKLLAFASQDLGLTFAIATGLVATSIAFGFLLVLKNFRDPLRRRIEAVANTEQSEAKTPKVEVHKRIVQGEQSDLSPLHQQFIFAGFRNTRAVSSYYIAKLVLTFGLPVLAFFTASLVPELSSKHLLIITMSAGAVGFIAPGMYLDRCVKNRQTAILNGFPDMLDLLVACSEAGLGLNAALQRVTSEISLSYPELAEELHTVNLEMRAGVDRMDALKGLAIRTGIEEISGLVSMLRQSIRFGSGISETLRIYSEEFRDKRMQKAEAVAGAIGTKMIFPLILCIFPAFFVVVIGPAAINIMEVLGSG